MQQQHKYARPERERRFLLNRFPDGVDVIRIRRITDHYIEGTALRLREQSDDGGPMAFKLTQKLSAAGAQQAVTT